MRPLTTRRWTATAAAGLLVTLGVTACGSNDASTTAGDAATNGADLSKVHFTGDPIKVMTASSYGNAQVDFKDPITVAQAAAVQINEHGGIAGHKLVVMTCNDGIDANSAAACARQAKTDGVAAYVGGTSMNPQVVMPILEQEGIPWLSSDAASAQETSSKLSYPLVAGAMSFGGIGTKAVQDGCKSIAVVRYDIPVSAGVVQVINQALSKAGGKVNADIPVPPTATSFDSIAAEVAKNDCAISVIPAQTFLGVVAATRQAGGTTRFYALASTLSDAVMKQGGSALEGTVTTTSFPADSDPIWKDAKAAAGSGVDWSYIYTDATWVGYQVLAHVLQDVKASDIDAKTVVQALNAASKVDTGGFTPTLDFTKELPVPGMGRIFNPTIGFLKVQNGALVADGAPVNLAASGS